MSPKSFCLVLSCLTALLLASCKKPPEVVTLGVISGLGGTLEPCGCTSHPLGGLDKLVGQLAPQKNEAFGWVAVGNTFFAHDDIPGHLLEQERRKAGTIAKVFAHAQPVAVLPGPADSGQQANFIQDLTAPLKLPILQQPKTSQTRSRADTLVRTIGGLKIGFIGMPAIQPEEAVAYTAGALALRKQGAEVVVALLPIGGENGRDFAKQLNAIDIIVGGGNEKIDLPAVIEGSLYVEAGDDGRYLGLLHFHKQGKGPFAFYDGGQSARQALEGRIARLQNEIADLPEGPGRSARQEKLQTLLTEQQNLKTPPPPTTSYVSWELHAIDKKLPTAEWATKELAQYNHSLCDMAQTATSDRVCMPATDTASTYVGTATCQACHVQAMQVYEKTKHAQAWATLEHAGKTCDVGCINCHSVGFEKAGGYCRIQDTEKFKNVGCENCHGPGSGHVDHPTDKKAWSSQFNAHPNQSTCIECHNQEHSDLFDFAKYLPRILGPGHGQK